MNVVVLGGSGVFGSLLAELLVRDGHRVWIAGRNARRGRQIANRLGSSWLTVDRDGDLTPLSGADPDAIVDAAGPFQEYGDDAYRVARYAIGIGAHYLDLSDATDFTAEISTLDQAAREAGVFVLSGASSVPGLSSSVVKELADGLDQIEVIDTAILPGNRAPRGRSVIESIVAGVGRPVQVRRGGRWIIETGWSMRREFGLAARLKGVGYLVDVPDLTLFPHFFRARSVLFRAGLELTVMNRFLALLSGARRFVRLPIGRSGVSFLLLLSKFLRPFGTDRGGMQVSVTGRVSNEAVRRIWDLVAEAGDGPYIPGAVVRAILRDPLRIGTGARPCLGEVPLPKIESALSDLRVRTSRNTHPAPAMFQTILGGDWNNLPDHTKALHQVHDREVFSGRAQVTRGAKPLARLTAWLFRFPPAGEDVPITVTKTRTMTGEIWQREFAGRTFRSVLSPAPQTGAFRERFGLFTFEMGLPIRDGSIEMPVVKGSFLGVPVPRFLLPKSVTREFVADGRFNFDVALSAPLGCGLIVRYRGWLEPVSD